MTFGFPELVEAYDLPVRDRNQLRREVIAPPRWRAALDRTRGDLRRRRRGRRLAYLDSTFPWRRSGFRYHEALAIHEALPDTLFFSVWDLEDPFPAPVHPLAAFPAIAPAAGITDAYGVFQLFLEGLVGLAPSGDGALHPVAGDDMSSTLRDARIRLHGSIYPGGGFTPTADGIAAAAQLASRLDTTFSYVPEVLANVPGVTPVDLAFTETRFYVPTSERWDRPVPFTCLFAADAPPRKGLDVALAAFQDLDPARFHLHVVGPHEHRRAELPETLATFHGWLSPEQLRDLHREAHAFVSPVSVEPPGPPGSHQGVIDGFPTQAASDAMSSGCLLISANPGGDHRVLTPDLHYVERDADAAAVRVAIVALADDPDWVSRVAAAGCEQIRTRTDIRRGTRTKLRHMGFPV